MSWKLEKLSTLLDDERPVATVIPGHDGDDSEAEKDAGPAHEDHEPEPEKNVDLLVDDIQRQNAQSVMVDNSS